MRLQFPENLWDYFWQSVLALFVSGLALFLGKASILVAIILGVLAAAALRANRANRRVEDLTKMIAGISPITPDDVLREAARADELARGMEDRFREAARKRTFEKDYIAQHGQLDSMAGTRSTTFEMLAKSESALWNRRFEELSAKLFSFGFRVFPPAKPSTSIEGEPTAEATKLICEREALTAAVDALRRANESHAFGAPQTPPAVQNS